MNIFISIKSKTSFLGHLLELAAKEIKKIPWVERTLETIQDITRPYNRGTSYMIAQQCADENSELQPNMIVLRNY